MKAINETEPSSMTALLIPTEDTGAADRFAQAAPDRSVLNMHTYGSINCQKQSLAPALTQLTGIHLAT